MPRHFFLRLPTSNNFPIACVAAELANVSIGQALDAMANNTKVDIDFAVATYNPNDEGMLPFSKKEGRNRAYGRLHSPFHRIRLCIENTPMDFSKGGVPIAVMREICKDMAQGRWRELHPAASAAHTAARCWLDNDAHRPEPTMRQALTIPEAAGFTPIAEISVDPVTPARSEPEHEVDRMHDEGNPNHSDPLEPHPTQAAVSRIVDEVQGTANSPNAGSDLEPVTVGDPEAPTHAEVLAQPEPITFHSAEEMAEEGMAERNEVQVMGRCNCSGTWHDLGSPECIVLPATAIDTAGQAEAEVIITVSPEDEAKLDRIFAHPEEDFDSMYRMPL